MDEYHGIGGSYIVDPETGERKPAPAVEEKTPNTEKEPKAKSAATDENLSAKD